jgi:hypothetical protein
MGDVKLAFEGGTADGVHNSDARSELAEAVSPLLG